MNRQFVAIFGTKPNCGMGSVAGKIFLGGAPLGWMTAAQFRLYLPAVLGKVSSGDGLARLASLRNGTHVEGALHGGDGHCHSHPASIFTRRCVTGGDGTLQEGQHDDGHSIHHQFHRPWLSKLVDISRTEVVSRSSLRLASQGKSQQRATQR